MNGGLGDPLRRSSEEAMELLQSRQQLRPGEFVAKLEAGTEILGYHWQYWLRYTHIYVYLYMYNISIYMYIYIYTYCIHMYMYMYIYIYYMYRDCMYMYIHIQNSVVQSPLVLSEGVGSC